MKRAILQTKMKVCILFFQFLPIVGLSQWVMVDSLNSPVLDINSSGGLIYACTATTGFYISTDSGYTFTASNNGLTNLNTRIILARDSLLFLGTNNSIYKSTDFGSSWSLSNNGIPLTIYSNVDEMVYHGDSVIAATFNNGIFISIDFGQTWTPMNNGFPDLNKLSLFVYSNVLFAGSGYYSGAGIFISENNGSSWEPRNNGVPKFLWDTNKYDPITSFSNIEETIFASTHGHGVLKSEDNGLNWIDIYSPYWYIWTTFSSGNTLLTGNDANGGINRTDDLGNTWQPMNEGLIYIDDKDIRTIHHFGPYIYIGTWSHKIFRRPFDQLITEIKKINDSNSAKICPNPITDCSRFLTDFPPGNKYNLELFNSFGICLLRILDFKPSQFELCICDYSKGIYYYRISKSNQSVYIGKFVVI